MYFYFLYIFHCLNPIVCEECVYPNYYYLDWILLTLSQLDKSLFLEFQISFLSSFYCSPITSGYGASIHKLMYLTWTYLANDSLKNSCHPKPTKGINEMKLGKIEQEKELERDAIQKKKKWPVPPKYLIKNSSGLYGLIITNSLTLSCTLGHNYNLKHSRFGFILKTKQTQVPSHMLHVMPYWDEFCFLHLVAKFLWEVLKVELHTVPCFPVKLAFIHSLVFY